jgi:hypothetical protein
MQGAEIRGGLLDIQAHVLHNRTPFTTVAQHRHGPRCETQGSLLFRVLQPWQRALGHWLTMNPRHLLSLTAYIHVTCVLCLTGQAGNQLL